MEAEVGTVSPRGMMPGSSFVVYVRLTASHRGITANASKTKVNYARSGVDKASVSLETSGVVG